MKLTDCENTTKQTPVVAEMNHIERTLQLLGEAIELLSIKTSDVRLSLPLCPANKEDEVDSCSPLVHNLRGISSAIERHTATINLICDEIQL